MEKGFVQIYYGAGRGKTNAALGNALRAAGENKSVIIIQFLKGKTDDQIFYGRTGKEVSAGDTMVARGGNAYGRNAAPRDGNAG